MFSLPISTTAPPLLALKPSDTASAVTSAKLKLHYSILLHRPQQCFPNISVGAAPERFAGLPRAGCAEGPELPPQHRAAPLRELGFCKKDLARRKKVLLLR